MISDMSVDRYRTVKDIELHSDASGASCFSDGKFKFGMALQQANETYPSLAPSEVWTERSILEGCFLETTGFGAHFVLYIFCARQLIRVATTKKWKKTHGLARWWLLIYITAMFLLEGITNATNLRIIEMSLIQDFTGPGSPISYEPPYIINVISMAAGFINMWLSDGLMLYRFLIFYGMNIYLFVIPGLMFLVTIATSCLLLFQLAHPQASILQKSAQHFGFIAWSISIGLNVILTAAICGRLLLHKRRAASVLPKDHLRPYVSIAAIIIESAALYTFSATFFLVAYIVGNSVSNQAIGILGPTQAIAPLLIIYRVATGEAWSRDTEIRMAGTAGVTEASVHSEIRFAEVAISKDRSDTAVFSLEPSDGSTSVATQKEFASKEDIDTLS